MPKYEEEIEETLEAAPEEAAPEEAAPQAVPVNTSRGVVAGTNLRAKYPHLPQ